MSNFFFNLGNLFNLSRFQVVPKDQDDIFDFKSELENLTSEVKSLNSGPESFSCQVTSLKDDIGSLKSDWDEVGKSIEEVIFGNSINKN